MGSLGTVGLVVVKHLTAIPDQFLEGKLITPSLAMQKSPGSTACSGSTRINIPSGKLGLEPVGAVMELPSTSSQNAESLAFGCAYPSLRITFGKGSKLR
jgi:hypothetical protein